MCEEEIIKCAEFLGNRKDETTVKIDNDFYDERNIWKGLLDLYNKEKENNKELKKANKKLQTDIEIKDKVIDLIIDDFQTEGYFKKMTYEQVKKYYDNRNELKQEINTLPLNLDLTAK